MSEFIGLFGHVSDVKAVKSLGVCRVIVEVPIEQHKAVTNGFWDSDVLITLSDGKMGYGMAKTDSVPEETAKQEDYGSHYQALYKSGFFNNPALWRLAGSDADYQNWVRQQKSCVSNLADYVSETGEMRCEYAHVRRVGLGSGTGIKPEYSGVPLTHSEHATQHQQGEAALLVAYGKRVSDQEAAAWFEKKAAAYRTEWIKQYLYGVFGVSSMKELMPSEFAAWAMKNGLYAALPSEFKG